jgi:hypothetical protein
VLCCTTTGKWDLNRIVSKISCADQSLGFEEIVKGKIGNDVVILF